MRRFALIIVLCVPPCTHADNESWLGKQVMLRESGTQMEVMIAGQRTGEMPLNSWEVLTVLREKDGRIWVRNREAEGWLDKSAAVLIEDAVEWFSQRIERAPQDESALAHRARAHHFLGEFDKATADFNDALKVAPTGAWIWNNRAIVWADLKEYDKAITDYTKALEINPSYFLPLSNRGLIWLRRKEFDHALADFANAIKHNPKYSHAFSNRALLWLEKRNFDEALKDSEQALRLSPGASSVRTTRGQVYFALKRFDDALREFDLAIDLEPKNASAYAQRARTFARLGGYAAAQRDFESAIRERPMIDWFYRDYAYFLATCKDAAFRDGKRALALMVEAEKRKIEPDGKTLSTNAAILAENGRFDEAIKRQEVALKDPHLAADDAAEFRERLKLYQRRKPWRE